MQYQTSLELEPFIEAAGRLALRHNFDRAVGPTCTSAAGRTGYTFLLDGETGELHLTYGVERRARAIAATLPLS